MGTKVQYKSFLPGYYSMRDLNEDTDSSWALYYGDKALNGHLFNGFMLKPHGYSEYDKERLKQTMLEHEAVFRKQVYELHRLYRTQKDLMDEFQKKGLFRYSFPAEISQSDSFSSQFFPSEGTKRMQMPHLSIAGTSYNKGPTMGTDDKMHSLNILTENSLQSCPISVRKQYPLRDGELLDSKLKSTPKKMFDLQLPDDSYIDRRDGEKETVFESPFFVKRIHSTDPENAVKLTLGTGEGPSCREDSCLSDSQTQNGLSTRCLADLNEPVKEISFEGVAGLSCPHFLGPRTPFEEKQWHMLPVISTTKFSGPHSAILKDQLNNEGSSSNLLHANKEEIGRGWPSFNNGADKTFLLNDAQSSDSMSLFSPDSLKEKYSISSEPVQLKLMKAQEIFLPDQKKTEYWLKEKPTHDIGTPSTIPSSSFSISSSSGYTSSASPLFSSWEKPGNSLRHDPLGVRGLPILNGMNAGVRNPSNASGGRKCNGDLMSHLRLGSELSSFPNGLSSYPNGFDHSGFLWEYSSGSQVSLPPINSVKPEFNIRCDSKSADCGPQKCFKGLLCTDVKTKKEVTLNQDCLNGIQHSFSTTKNKMVNDSELKYSVSSDRYSWFGRKQGSNTPQTQLGFAMGSIASQLESDSAPGYSQLNSSRSTVNSVFEKHEGVKGLSQCRLQGFPSNSSVKDTSKKIFGFSIPDEVQQRAVCSFSHQLKLVSGDAKSNEKDPAEVALSEKQFPFRGLVTENGVESTPANFRNHINLNSEISIEDEVTDAPLQLSAPTSRVVSGIDLEAPTVSQEEDSFISPQEPIPAIKLDGTQETEWSHEELAKEAAHNILLMSVGKCRLLDEITCQEPSSPVPFNTLHWLAEVVSSNAGCVKESPYNGLDLFELMTLNLEETKADEYWCQQRGQVNQHEDCSGRGAAASLLLSKARRGQARKRRQRRDFQKDILPGLATLSRHEVTEDLQTIGGLMKASGMPWEVGVTRRNMGRDGLNSRTRGRRRPRSSAITIEEIEVSPPSPPPQPTNNNTEVEVDGRSIIGWGRTTRRCRRQRCPPLAAVTATLI